MSRIFEEILSANSKLVILKYRSFNLLTSCHATVKLNHLHTQYESASLSPTSKSVAQFHPPLTFSAMLIVVRRRWTDSDPNHHPLYIPSLLRFHKCLDRLRRILSTLATLHSQINIKPAHFHKANIFGFQRLVIPLSGCRRHRSWPWTFFGTPRSTKSSEGMFIGQIMGQRTRCFLVPRP